MQQRVITEVLRVDPTAHFDGYCVREHESFFIAYLKTKELVVRGSHGEPVTSREDDDGDGKIDSVTIYQHDQLGRLTKLEQRTTEKQELIRAEQWTYTPERISIEHVYMGAEGRIASTDQIVRERDRIIRIEQETEDGTRSLSFTYRGSQLDEVASGTHHMTFATDVSGRIVRATTANNGHVIREQSLEYDAAGRLTMATTQIFDVERKPEIVRFHYDAEGFPVREEHYEGDDLVERTRYVYRCAQS